MVHFCNYSFINKSYSFLKKKKIEVYAQGPVYKTQVHRRKITRGDAILDSCIFFFLLLNYTFMYASVLYT